VGQEFFDIRRHGFVRVAVCVPEVRVADPAFNAAAHLRVLTEAYSPGGFNMGMNLGRVAGAGIADHLHWHVVPRWEGDTNFMPMLADTRVISQHLVDAYDRLLPLFERETA